MTAGPKGVRRFPPPSSRRRPRRSPPLAGLCRPPLLLTMLLGGLWHGASWNFVLWGGLHGTYLTIERILRGEGKVAPASWTTLRAWLKATWIFVLVSVTWVFFRSPSLEVTRTVWQKLLLLDSAGLAWWLVPAVLPVPAMVLGGIRRPAVGMAVPHRGDVEPAAPGRLGTRGLPRVLLRRPGQLALQLLLLPVLKREGLAIGRVPPERS